MLSAIILISLVGCQQGEVAPTVRVILPTLVPSLTPVPPTPDETIAATVTRISQRATLPPSYTPTYTATVTPTPRPITATPSPSPTATLTPFPSPTRQRPPMPDSFSFGNSVQGRDLIAHRFGGGGAMLMLIGGIHTGFESNTVTLVEQMVAHFQATPSDVLPGITLVLIPALNVDGREQGRQLGGRFNANGVDLNRNWDCNWEPVAYFKDGEVDPGIRPFSEPESLLLAALINDLRPDAVLFYHSAANGVFPGHCNSSEHSAPLAQAYAAGSRYPYGATFDDYEVTGTGPDWVDGLGIPAADVELASAELPELSRNLRGVMAVQCWLLGPGAGSLPACNG